MMMLNVRVTSALACCIVGLFAASEPSRAAAGYMTGQMVSVKGNVEIFRRGDEQWIRAKPGMPVEPGDRIMTGFKGEAVFMFENSLTKIKPVTQIVVGRAIESGEQYYTELFIPVGKVVTEVANGAGRKNDFVVISPKAMTQVKGTVQECRYTPGVGMRIDVPRGKVDFGGVSLQNLPAPVQALLDPAAGRTPSPASPQDAANQFNAWIQNQDAQMRGGASMDQLGTIDPATFEWKIQLAEGEQAQLSEQTDGTDLRNAGDLMNSSSTVDMTPRGLSPKEEAARAYYVDPVDGGLTGVQDEERGSLKDVGAQATAEATETLINLPPPRPE